MSRIPAEIRDGLLSLLPPGWIWPRDPASEMGRLLEALGTGTAEVEAAAEALLPEVDPGRADLLLDDYERVLGPDPCGREDLATTTRRRQVAAQRWTARGGQSEAYFIALAALVGEAITIVTYRPSRAGSMRAGRRLVPTSARFCWTVRLARTRVSHFRVGRDRAGTRLGTIELSDVECLIRRAAPAHTTPIFSYTG